MMDGEQLKEQFAEEVLDQLNQQAQAEGVDPGTFSRTFAFPDISVIIGLITSIISAIRACKNPTPAPTPTPTPAPVPGPAPAAFSEGQELHDIAVESWNERQGRYHGWQYSRAVAKAVQKSTEKRHKAKREDAVQTINAMFDRAQAWKAADLELICGTVPN